MPEHIRYEDDDLFNKETHHEVSDVPIRPLFVFIVIFIVMAFVTHFLILFMYKALAKGERTRAEAPFTRVARPEADKVPQQPLLQPFPRKDAAGEVMPPNTNTPRTDLVEIRAAEDRALHHYGWVDKEKGVVHVPIEVAKELAVRRLSGAAPASGAGVTPTAAEAAAAPPATATTTGGQP